MTDQEKQRLADKKEYITNMFNVCDNDAERRVVFFMFAEDMSYPRHIICQVMKELGINDDMSLKKIVLDVPSSTVEAAQSTEDERAIDVTINIPLVRK